LSRLSPASTFLAGLQWLFFMFTNTVVIPLSIGAALHLSAAEITASVQRSFIYTGIACLLQAFLGHRYALMEGQSGLWWGVILSLCATAASSGMDLRTAGGALALGILLSGIIIAILAALGIGKLLKRIFTPIVMSVFLILLASQLTLIFFKGMIGLSGSGEVVLFEAGLSMILVFIVGWLNLKGKGLASNFSILIGIIIGWGIHASWMPTPQQATGSYLSLFTFFPWGPPNMEWGIVITAVLTGLLNTTNTVATLRGAEDLFGKPTMERQMMRSFVITGFNGVMSGLFGMVPYAPYTSSLGFLQTTRIFTRSAFVVGAVLFMILGLVPSLGTFFSTMPISVGDAVLFVAYLQLFGSALRNLEGIHFNSKTIYRIAAPTLLGLAIINIPAASFGSLPVYLRPLLSNGLLMGIILAIITENTIDWSQFEQTRSNEDMQKQVMQEEA
jgi:xanthine/uracil permease